MKTKKIVALILTLAAPAFLTTSCFLFDEEELPDCGADQTVETSIINASKRVSIDNYVTQDGTYSYYEFEFPPEITDLELCVEEHCVLKCSVSFKESVTGMLNELKLEGMIEVGFTEVEPFNPYWKTRGRTFEDPDGYRVVLQNDAWGDGA